MMIRKSLFRQTFAFVGISGFNFIVNIFAYSLFALSLNEQELGQAAYIHISYLLGTTLSTVGFYKLILKEGLPAIKFTAINDLKIFGLTITFALISVILLFFNLIDFSSFEETLFIFLALGALYPAATRPRALFEHKLKFIRARLPALCSNVISVIVAIIIWYVLNGYFAFLAWRFMVAFLEMVWFGIEYYKLNKINDNDFSHCYRKFWRFCFPVWGSAALVFIAGNIDYLIIGSYLTINEVGIYWLCFQYGNYLMQFRTLFITVLTPLFVKLDDLLHRQQIFKIVLDFLFIIPLLLVCFTLIERQFIRSLDIGVLSQSIELFGLVMVGFVIRMYSSFLEVFAVAERKSSILLLSSTVTSLLFVLLLLVLIPRYGIMGAIASYITCSIIIFGYSVFVYAKYIGYLFIRSNLFESLCKLTVFLSVMMISSIIFGVLFCFIILCISVLISLIRNFTTLNSMELKYGRD